MDIKKVLEYQKMDSELFKLEKQLRESENRKSASQMQEKAKQAQERSTQLEQKAGALLKEIETVRGQYSIQEKKMNEVFAKKKKKMRKEEVEAMLTLKDKLAQNLNILDKNLTKLAENVNAVLAEFNKTVKLYNMAKEKYTETKTAYDKEVSQLEPKKQELALKLSSMAKTVDAKLMEQYAKRRKDNIFPVLVPLQEQSCGGCHVELPISMISKLKEEGVLSCEHCHRIIYSN